jgi:V8-like Glu-specific endopeptidase
MRLSADVVAQTNRLLPDLGKLEEHLQNQPETILDRAFPAEETVLGTRAVIVEPTITSPNHPIVELEREAEPAAFEQLEVELRRERERNVRTATTAVGKLRRGGTNADFAPEEVAGLEAIILDVGRPAILILNGNFFPPPLGWEILDQARDSIESTFSSVGRIEVDGDPNMQWVGTGFLVADDVVMTNRHVAKVFSRWETDGQWTFEPGIEPSINYGVELGETERKPSYVFESVAGVHEEFDLALLKVSRESAGESESTKPLTLASEAPANIESHKVYVIGYPAWDGRRNDPPTMQRIFADIYGVKRLQPGEVRRVFDERSIFHHDCSTLGGNSGSCVIDIETNKVIGLHFGGLFHEANQAVALWKLTTDELLNRAGVVFG